MNIIFAGSKGKTGSVVFNYLKERGYTINYEINIDSPPLTEVIKKESIIIDFTNKEAAYNHALTCLNEDSHFICGTTAIEKEKINYLLAEAKNKNLYFSFNPNFSLSINPICKFISKLKPDLPKTKIIESHHISKKDLPSGTALLLKENLFEDTKIESLRTTYISLEHSISLENDYEQVIITHSVKDKLAYAKGVEKTLKEILSKIKK